MILDGNYWSSLSSGPLKEIFNTSQFLLIVPGRNVCWISSKVRFCPLCFFHFGTHGEHGKRKGNGSVDQATGNHHCGQVDEQANDVLGCIRELMAKEWSKGCKRFWKDLWNSLHSCGL